MQRHPESPSTILFSPSDLTQFMASEFATWMERCRLEPGSSFRRDPKTAEDEMFSRQGQEFEARQVWAVASCFPVFSVPQGPTAAAETEAAMRRGEPVIYQAVLRHGDWEGRADLLYRVPGRSRLGDFHYEVCDVKLSRTPKPAHLVQLCCYAALLEAIQGTLPRHLVVWLGDGTRRVFRTIDYVSYYRFLKQRFEQFIASFDPAIQPEPVPNADNRPYESYVEQYFKQTDHLVRVANITKRQIQRLRAAGIDTLTGLATTSAQTVARMDDATLAKLREQARLQKESEGEPVPAFRVLIPEPLDPRRGLALLPPASEADVFFDMEGFPLLDGRIEYLFGVAHFEGGAWTYSARWAHDATEEKAALADFLDWVHERWVRDPTLHVYHYASYERSALQRLVGHHATREAKFDDLMHAGAFIDLYTVVRHGLRVGTQSYSLKDIERLYRPARATDVASAGESMVEYERWLSSSEARDPAGSPILAALRDYNADDCHSTRELCDWLRARQAEHGIEFVESTTAPKTYQEDPLATTLLAQADGATTPEEARVARLFAGLVEFHRREDRPKWWAVFERAAMSDVELLEDMNCIGGMKPIARKPGGCWFSFDPGQDTKLHQGSRVRLTQEPFTERTIEELDLDLGELRIDEPALVLHPDQVYALIANEHVRACPVDTAVAAVARDWLETGQLPPPIETLVSRTRPRLHNVPDPILARPGMDAATEVLRVAAELDRSTLCVQGPPGTGKTWTAAAAIEHLLSTGRAARIAVSSNSHDAIVKVLAECGEASGWTRRILKVGRGGHAIDGRPGVTRVDGGAAGARAARQFQIVGGTAWLFARDDLAGAFDYLFVDEAGQVSLANLVAMSRAARNIVLVGDQMQLAQPTQGSHPGEAGASALEYALAGHVTVPSDRGILLNRTRRLHPAVCTVVSSLFYEERLEPLPDCEKRIIKPKKGAAGGDAVEAGVRFVPVPHEHNRQASDEEVAVIRELISGLIGRRRTDTSGKVIGTVSKGDILVVAPFNLQVHRLTQALPGVRVGTVDKFQGQEAPIVIVSLCASDANASPRGLDFLFDPHRLNVAISRPQSLVIVVGNPGLAHTRCAYVEQMKSVNRLCAIVEAGTAATAKRR